MDMPKTPLVFYMIGAAAKDIWANTRVILIMIEGLMASDSAFTSSWKFLPPLEDTPRAFNRVRPPCGKVGIPLILPSSSPSGVCVGCIGRLRFAAMPHAWRDVQAHNDCDILSCMSNLSIEKITWRGFFAGAQRSARRVYPDMWSQSVRVCLGSLQPRQRTHRRVGGTSRSLRHSWYQ